MNSEDNKNKEYLNVFSELFPNLPPPNLDEKFMEISKKEQDIQDIHFQNYWNEVETFIKNYKPDIPCEVYKDIEIICKNSFNQGIIYIINRVSKLD